MSNVEMIKELRNITLSAIQECKMALEESNWDLNKAINIIKTKGLNIADSKESKITSEGILLSYNEPESYSCMVEVLCETDFLAKSKEFKELANLALEELKDYCQKGSVHNDIFSAVDSARKDLISKSKENIQIRRRYFTFDLMNLNGYDIKSFCYNHNSNLASIVTIKYPSSIKFMSDMRTFEIKKFSDDLALQVAAMNPLSVSPDNLDKNLIENQKSIFLTQIKELNKPISAHDKILDGKFNKWYTDVCLLKQEALTKPKTSIEQMLKDLNDRYKIDVSIVDFKRFKVGESI